MAFYTAAREGVTPVAGNVLLALTTGLQEIAKISEIAVAGESSTSTINRMTARRSTTNGTTPTAQTPAKVSSTSPAAYTDVATTFSGEPTTASNPAVWTYGINTYGGLLRWLSAPGQEPLVQGATAGNNEVSIESTSGTGVVTLGVVFEEI